MEIITTLLPAEAEALLQWCKIQQLEEEVFTGRVTCRKKKWWGIEAEFYFSQSHCFEREPIESDLFLKDLRDRFKPEADSILLYKYEIGGEIGTHKDKLCFDKWVTLINLVDEIPDLFGNRSATKFKWGIGSYLLNHGDVIRFDSRIEHAIPKLKAARYSLQFRKIAQ
jgi:alkylated DNA repair dioxygenase AlkB